MFNKGPVFERHTSDTIAKSRSVTVVILKRPLLGTQVIFLALTLSLGNLACNPCTSGNPGCAEIGPVGVDLSGALSSINNALANLTTSGDTWIATLTALVQDLQGQGFTHAATFVRTTLQDGIARVGVEFRCNADFTVARIRRGLESLKAAITASSGDQVPSTAGYRPFVCSATPDRVSWQEAPQIVSLAGYDFARGDLRVFAIESSGQETDISSVLTLSSSYQMAINLSSAGAGFPRPCAKVAVRWNGSTISEVPCLTDCPAPPPPIVVPAKTMTVLNETQTCTDAMLTGCRFDRYTGQACPDGYFRKELQITKVAGSHGGRDGNCGEGDVNTPGQFSSHWQTANPSDCSVHEHIGLRGGFNHFQTCRFIVIAERPQTVIPRPAPAIGWCR